MPKTDKTIKELFDEKWMPEPNSGCWLWTAAVDKDQYGVLGNDRKTYRSHRLSYELYCDMIPNGMVVRHKCDNTLCVNPDHLEIGTQMDNIADMVSRRRHPIGEDKPTSKLTEKQVIDIFRDVRSNSDIEKDYPVTRSQIRKIKLGIRWGWLTKDL